MSIIKSSVGIAIVAVLGFAAPVQAGENRHAVADFNSCKKPMYPSESLAARHEGNVTLSFLVDATGSVLDAKVFNSSGHPTLDEAARDAIRLCTFKPAIKDGKPVQDWVKVRYDWTLK